MNTEEMIWLALIITAVWMLRWVIIGAVALAVTLIIGVAIGLGAVAAATIGLIAEKIGRPLK